MNIDPFHPRTEQDFLRQQVAALTRERDEVKGRAESEAQRTKDERRYYVNRQRELYDEIAEITERAETAERERDEAVERTEQAKQEYRWLADAIEEHLNPRDGDESEVALLIEAVEDAKDRAETAERECDEALKKLEKIKEISQVWNVVDDDATTKIIALNRIHIIAGGKT